MTPDTLLEASWAGRGRTIRGRELRIELLVTACFTASAVVLALTGGHTPHLQPVTAMVVLALALAARVEFPIGAGYFVPTQLFLVPLFAVAPAPIVPLMVFAAYGLAGVGAAASGRAGADRLAFTGGDAFHALGPAVVITLMSDGDAMRSGVGVIALAFAAQLLADLLSSSVHETLTMGARPTVHVRTLLEVWAVDLALGSVGLLAAGESAERPWAALAPLPLLLLLRGLATDRSRRIDAANSRQIALEHERGRRLATDELLERQNQFLQDASHELRTPLTIARGHVEMLLRVRGSSPETEVAIDELARMERIVDRLLVLARTDTPEGRQIQRLDAEELLEDRFVRWSDTTQRSWQLGDLCPGSLTGDGDALRAALDALLENAVKHTTPDQSIRLSSRLERGGLEIEIADGGPGMPKEALDRIFDRFARVDSARNREVGGVGLGLALVRAVAVAHGGTCSVQSSPGGSTFCVWLPPFEPASASATP